MPLNIVPWSTENPALQAIVCEFYLLPVQLVWKYKQRKEEATAATCQPFTEYNKDFLSRSWTLILSALKAAVTSHFKATTVSAEVLPVLRGFVLLAAPPYAQLWKCLQVSGPDARQHHVPPCKQYKSVVSCYTFILHPLRKNISISTAQLDKVYLLWNSINF